MCDCVLKVNKLLSEHNTKIDMVDTISMTTGKFETRMCVPTTRIETLKRKGPMKVFATFCPMCGVSLQRQESVSASEEPGIPDKGDEQS